MRRRLIRLFVLYASSFLLVGGRGPVLAAAISHTDAEIVLRLDGITQSGTANPASLEIFGSGSRQVGPVTPAVFDSFNQLRIAGGFPPNNTQVAMLPAPSPNGDALELDGQTGVRTDTLVAGQAAELLITLSGAVGVANHNAFDTSMNFHYEREFFLRTTISNPATEQALSRGTFHILGTSFSAAGTPASTFQRDFDQSLSDGTDANPEEKFNFNFLVPAGGTARFDMTATAYSRVAIVPEPATVSLVAAALSVGLLRRRRFLGHRECR